MMRLHHFYDVFVGMRLREIKSLVDSTCDPAFAVDGGGRIAAWNRGAEKLFGLPVEEAMGRLCGHVLEGSDACGLVCSENCTVRQAVERRHPMENFDLQVTTIKGRQWCNVSVLIIDEEQSLDPFAVHIVRSIDLRKRLELMVQDFIVSETAIQPAEALAIVAGTRAPARSADLSVRELEILRLLAYGESTEAIASRLHLSRSTVNNHIQHCMKKLDAHSRLEAIRRAEQAGLIAP
jgi:PAS domain S-box-containing protein